MSEQSSVTEAAERLRRIESGERQKLVYEICDPLDDCDYDIIDGRWRKDQKLVAMAMLAELSPDAITPTALEDIGYVCTQGGTDGFRFREVGGSSWVGLKNGVWSFGHFMVSAHGITSMGEVATLRRIALRLSGGAS